MSLTKTKSTTKYKLIPKKCKNCNRAIYAVEEGEVYYSCSLSGTFKRTCDYKIEFRKLPKPSEILKK